MMSQLNRSGRLLQSTTASCSQLCRLPLPFSSSSTSSDAPSRRSRRSLSQFPTSVMPHHHDLLFHRNRTDRIYNNGRSRSLHVTPAAGQRRLGILVGVRLNVEDPKQAAQFVDGLSQSEKQALLRHLARRTKDKSVSPSDVQSALNALDTSTASAEAAADPNASPETEAAEDATSTSTDAVSRADLRTLFLLNTIPFVGFGFLDNFIMIIAGEYIDMTLGVWLHISTMAAAGLGNLISDAIGVGAGGYIEYLMHRFTRLRPPKLSHAQEHSNRVRYAQATGRTVGIVVGCLIGMFPLIFFDESKKQQQARLDEADNNKTAAEPVSVKK